MIAGGKVRSSQGYHRNFIIAVLPSQFYHCSVSSSQAKCFMHSIVFATIHSFYISLIFVFSNLNNNFLKRVKMQNFRIINKSLEGLKQETRHYI